MCLSYDVIDLEVQGMAMNTKQKQKHDQKTKTNWISQMWSGTFLWNSFLWNKKKNLTYQVVHFGIIYVIKL